jgi:hypothetical protein
MAQLLSQNLQAAAALVERAIANSRAVHDPQAAVIGLRAVSRALVNTLETLALAASTLECELATERLSREIAELQLPSSAQQWSAADLTDNVVLFPLEIVRADTARSGGSSC